LVLFVIIFVCGQKTRLFLADKEGMANLYLDIDGVLLGKDSPTSPVVILANHAREFLTFALANFHCYWLTSRCKGDVRPVLHYLHLYAPDDMMPMLRRISPTNFDTIKTEALRGDFYWVDDSPSQAELDWLKEHNLLDRWVNVNTRKCPEDLVAAMGKLISTLPVSLA
jgi:hypothetical protein